MGSSLYNDAMNGFLEDIERALPGYLPPADQGLQKTVFEGMQYACAAGGKRLRPVLVMEFCRVCGGDAQRALPFACAMEMIHSYSLVHDDLPCMDNSPMRRGRPSAHAAFGEAMALLAGDGLLTRAFEVMLNPENWEGIDPRAALQAAYCLADAAGANGMVGGQVIDLQSEGKTIELSALEELQRGKTAALIRAACEMGCWIAGADAGQREAARTFGTQLGLCFQIVDDILDATSTSEAMGKPTGSDDANGKATYVSLLGLEQANRLAAERTAQAVAALQCFADEAAGLKKLANALLSRAQ